MSGEFFVKPNRDPWQAFCVVLGVNEIASAVAVLLRRAGWSVVLCHDPDPPVIRRAMAFHDVLAGDAITIEGIAGRCAETTLGIWESFARPDQVAVTSLHLTEILALRSLGVLVDARMQKYTVTPDLRNLARVTVGLGPNFSVGENCDIAVETRPVRSGIVVQTGSTDAADRVANQLGGVGSARFVYSDFAGQWRTIAQLGEPVSAGAILGSLNKMSVRAPMSGVLRGVVRDGLNVNAGVKLLEVDPRGASASWSGIDARGRGIARATLEAIQLKLGPSVAGAPMEGRLSAEAEGMLASNHALRLSPPND